MEQIDLKQLVEQYPEVLTDGTKLKAYILDLYPSSKRGMVNILVAIQQCGIVAEMQASKNPSALDMSRWKKVLDDDYGFAGATAETCLQLWCSAVGIQLEIKASAEAKPNKPNDNIPQKIEEKTDGTLALQDSQDSQKNWFEYDGTTLLKLKEKYRDYKGEIHIPDSVTSIGDSAFYCCSSLTSVTIPNTVISIGNFAFRDCSNLANVTIPDSVTSIGYSAFQNCSNLTNVTIPDSVTSISEMMLSGCKRLTNVTMPKGLLKIDMCTFRDCSSLVSITIPDSVTSIGKSAFERCCNLMAITIPNSVTSIDAEAFRGCVALTSITIPDSVTFVGYFAFYGCNNLKSVTIPDSVKNIDTDAFRGCPIETASIPAEECRTIGAYIKNTNLKTVVITSGAKIRDHAFDGCSSLVSVVIPSGVTNIGDGAFCGCENLTTIVIPDTVTNIGILAFEKCNLASIKVDSGNTTYHSQNNCVIETADGVLLLGCNTSAIPDDGSVMSIGKYAFSGCTDLTNITIPGSVMSIGDYAFRGCTDLMSITVPDSVMKIGKGAFFNCTGLTSITIPNHIENIGDEAFRGTGLTDITIPDRVTKIGDLAFGWCRRLNSITIPDCVERIGNEVFKGCNELTSINYEGTKAQWKAIYKGVGWRGLYDCFYINSESGSYIVHCTDGDIPKNES